RDDSAAGLPRLEGITRAVDRNAQLAGVLRPCISMRRIEHQHDAHDRLRELRVADRRDAATRYAIIGLARGQAERRAGDVDDDLVRLAEGEQLEGDRGGDAD